MRDCSWIKRWMRATGADKFDDFEMMLLVHEINVSTTKSKATYMVRVTAGLQTVETDENSKGIFQQPLPIFVEQGTEAVEVELLEGRGRKVLASLKLDPVEDILKPKHVHEKVLPMKQKIKGVHSPRIKLTIVLDREDEAERGLLSGVELGTESTVMLRQQLQKVERMHAEETLKNRGEWNEVSQDIGAASSTLSDLDLLAKGCCGPLDLFGTWGNRDTVYVGVKGPQEGVKRYFVGVWKDKLEFDRGGKASPEIDLLKITSVQPDPGRTEVFVLNYLDSAKIKKRLIFRRIDRNRDVWVEMFQLLIKMMHDQKEQKKKNRV